jgi:7,8-dihydroneopterin aldolase/epimerase/oxygenase
MSLSKALIEPRPQRAAQTADGGAYLTIAAGHVPGLEPLPQTTPQRSRIFVQGLRIDARIGAYDWEKATPQPLQIDLEFGLVSQLACHTDRLGDAVDYAEVIGRLKELANARHFELVEAMGEAMAMVLQSEFGVPWLVLRLSKLAPFPGAEVGIVVERGRRP